MDSIEVEKEDVFKGVIAVLLAIWSLVAGFKLLGVGVVATWPWWAVTSPIWLPIALVAVIFVGLVLLSLFIEKS